MSRAQDAALVDKLLADVARAAHLERPSSGWTVESASKLIAPLDEASDLELRPGEDRGRLLSRLREGLDELKASTQVRAYVVQLAVAWLRQDNHLDEARSELTHAVTTYDRKDPWVFGLWVDLAAQEFYEGRWDEAYRLLDECRPAMKSPDEGEAGGSREEREAGARTRALAAGAWHATRAQVDLELGLADRASESIDQVLDLARTTRDPLLHWNAVELELQLDLALGDYSGLAREIKEARDTEGYAELPAELRDKHRLYEAAALGERERRGEVPAGNAVKILRELVDAPTLDVQYRCEALVILALSLGEAGELTEARPVLQHAREIMTKRGRTSGSIDPRNAVIDAIDVRLTFTGESTEVERKSALERLEHSLEAFLESWRHAPPTPGGIGFLHYGTRYLVLSEMMRACRGVDGDPAGIRRGLGWILRAQSLGNLARSMSLEAQVPDDVVSSLVAGGRGCIFLLPGRDRSDLILADAQGLAVFDAGPSWRLMQLAGELRVAIQPAIHARLGMDQAGLDDELGKLATALLPAAALRRMLSWTSAIVAVDESVGYMPLECVKLDDGRRLGDVLPISHASSLLVQATLERRSRARAGRPADRVHVRIVGAPVVSATDQERWKPEPIEVEPSRWDRWASRWPTRAEVIAGQAATPSTLLTAGVQDVDILQLVVHGLFDQDRARQAGFLMAADGAGSGSLWPEEIESARMPPLVLLAVCEAARAKLRRGDDGRGGMAAAFALGGADCVVLTPADLFLDAAIDLFERVHTRLAAGSSPSEALRDARAQIRVERGDVPLQDYLVHAWGAGDGHFVEPAPHARSPLAEEKNSSNRDRTWILFGAAGLALLIAILAAFRAGRRST